MTTIQRTETRCDLCGYGGPYSDPAGFTRRSGFDFCRWCMSAPIRSTESGGHKVTVTGRTWTCSCGELSTTLIHRLRDHGVTLAAMSAVPDLAAATAAIHVQTPHWPQAW